MILDFKEIPAGNKGAPHQDAFEQFACAFLMMHGYRVIQHHGRGADGGVDLIVEETRIGISKNTVFRWLVSCKHFAHSKNERSVSPKDEAEILDRVRSNGCDGFIGFYSTTQSQALVDRTSKLTEIDCDFFDGARIERMILSHTEKEIILHSYFPISVEKYQGQRKNTHLSEVTPISNQTPSMLDEDYLLNIHLTAIILLEIDKIRVEFEEGDWITRIETLDKLYKYSEYRNTRINEKIFDFVISVAHLTRSRMPSEFASSVYSIVVSFFPYYDDSSKNIDDSVKCNNIGFVLAYDALIHANDFKIALYGLLILKYVYHVGRRAKQTEICEHVLYQFSELAATLSRPERNDLENAKVLVGIIKDDLESNDMSIPSMPQWLYELVC